MPAYFISCIKSITDPQGLQRYREGARPTLAPYAPKLISGPLAAVLEGGPLEAAVILKFDDVQTAKDWYNSAEYQQVRPARVNASDCTVFIIETKD
jgi:uncharacterized protein (DUF1330 family)